MPIRQISSEDAAAFQELRLRGLRESPESFSSCYEEEVNTPLDMVSAGLTPWPNGARWGYCFHGSELIGVLGIYRERQRKLSHKAVIGGVYVAPEHRRGGVGRALVSHALEYAANVLKVQRVNLGVNTRSTAAVALYRSMGFETYGTEPGFLMVDGIAHDEHLMTRQVQGAA